MWFAGSQPQCHTTGCRRDSNTTVVLLQLGGRGTRGGKTGVRKKGHVGHILSDRQSLEGLSTLGMVPKSIACIM